MRGLLVEELGVDPGPALRRLEEQILLQSPALGGEADRPVLAGGIGNLPALTSELVGRGPTSWPPCATWCATTGW